MKIWSRRLGAGCFRHQRKHCMNYLILLLLVTLFSGCASVPEGPVVDIAKLDGWCIVVSDDSIPAEKYAAEELQRLYAEASGRRIPIQAVADSGALGRILVGQSAAADAESISFRPSRYGPEDIRIVIAEGEIVIAGGRPRGTLYGVYTFAEDYLGVRFLTADHTHVPRLPESRLMSAVDRTYSPPIPWRYTYYGENHDHHDFAVRLRQNAIAADEKYGGLSDQRLINHSVSGLLPWSKYGAQHPEYFCLRDGKRPTKLLGHQTYEIQPCFSNPEARRIMLGALREQIKREYPKWKGFSVSQDDNDEFCTCPDCAAKDEKAGCHTGQLLDFVNWIAGEIAKEYPDVTIGTLIYQWSRTPLKNMKPARNVKLQLCSIECCQIHPIDDPSCPLNKPFQEDLAGWAKLSDNIAIWNYNVNFQNYLVPCPNLFNLTRNVRYFQANHARGIFMQAAAGTEGAEFSELRNYIISNLLWDPSRDGEMLMQEFLTLHYGPAAPPIRRFIDRIQAAAQQSGKHRCCFGMAADYGLTAELGRQGIADFAEALKLAPDEATKLRVEKASLAAWRLAIEPVADALSKGKPLDPQQKDELRPTVKQFLDLCKKHDIKLLTENTRFDDGAKLLEALLVDTAAQAQQADPFAAMLQKALDVVQKPGQPVQFTLTADLQKPGAPQETASLQLIRMGTDAFHLEMNYGEVNFALQRSPDSCFIYFPKHQKLYVAEGGLSPEQTAFTSSALEQAIIAADPNAAVPLGMAKTINGQAAAAMLAVVGHAPAQGQVKDGMQEFTINLPGEGGKLVFQIEQASGKCHEVRFNSKALDAVGRPVLGVPASLPPVPSGAANIVKVPRNELEAALTQVVLRQLKLPGATPSDPTSASNGTEKLASDLEALFRGLK